MLKRPGTQVRFRSSPPSGIAPKHALQQLRQHFFSGARKGKYIAQAFSQAKLDVNVQMAEDYCPADCRGCGAFRDGEESALINASRSPDSEKCAWLKGE
jgi:hypothetical protein